MEKRFEQTPRDRNIEGIRTISMEEWINLEAAAVKHIQEKFNDGKAEIEEQKIPSGGQTITVRDAETGKIMYFSCEAGNNNKSKEPVNMEEFVLMETRARMVLQELIKRGKATKKTERNPKTGKIETITFRDDKGKILLMYNYKELDNPV